MTSAGRSHGGAVPESGSRRRSTPAAVASTPVVASRGRILRRIGGWDDATRDEYTHMCADRAHELARRAKRPLQDWAEDAQAAVPEGPALLGFIAARIAEEVDGLEGYHRERQAQARWLVDRLGLEETP